LRGSASLVGLGGEGLLKLPNCLKEVSDASDVRHQPPEQQKEQQCDQRDYY